jgi:hypothetical protein
LLLRLAGLLDVDRLELGLQFLAGLELDDRALRDHDVRLRTVRVATDAALADLDLEDAEVTELDVTTSQQGFADGIQGHLDRVADMLLGVTLVRENLQDDVALGEVVGHDVA